MKFISPKDNQNLIEDTLLSNYDRYYRLAYSYVHNDADAGDIVQNGAYRAIKNSRSLKNKEYVASWVYRIMLNEIFRFLGRKDNSCVPLEEVEYEQGAEEIYEDIDLRRALESLPLKDKAVVELRFFEEQKLEDIALILEENVSTVKSRLYRSMKKLRLIMEERQEGK